jgi:hypothetical protein
LNPADGSCRRRQKVVFVVQVVVKTIAKDVENALIEVENALNCGDMIGAFVGRECRGVGTMEEGTFSPLTVYCQKAGEPVALRYYDAAKKKIITFTTTFKPE